MKLPRIGLAPIRTLPPVKTAPKVEPHHPPSFSPEYECARCDVKGRGSHCWMCEEAIPNPRTK